MPRPRSPSDAQAAVRKAALRLTEKDVERTVTHALTASGWRWVHFRPARTEKGWRTPYSGYDGFPDIIALKARDRMLALELKGWRGKVSEDQQAWLDAFDRVPGCYARVVTPDNMDEVLVEIARP